MGAGSVDGIVGLAVRSIIEICSSRADKKPEELCEGKA
jgi:hypothetical protein